MEKKRNIWFDNVKVILLILVVFGHVIEQLRFQDRVFLGIYNLIYLFHMPLFVFCSGAFAKADGKRIVKKYLIPYGIFQILFGIFDVYVMGTEEFHFLESYYVLWYLLALSVWSLLIPLIRTNGNRKKQVVMLGGSVAVGLMAGFIPWIGKEFSLSRIFVFFPFFLAGFYWQQEGGAQIDSYVPRICCTRFAKFGAAILLVLAGAAVYACSPRINTWALYGYTSYEFQGYTVTFRFLQYVAAVVLSLLFIRLVPKEKAIGENFADKMMPIYLLHVPLIKWIEKFGILDRLHNGAERFAYALAATIIIFVVCAGITQVLELAGKDK